MRALNSLGTSSDKSVKTVSPGSGFKQAFGAIGLGLAGAAGQFGISFLTRRSAQQVQATPRVQLPQTPFAPAPVSAPKPVRASVVEAVQPFRSILLVGAAGVALVALALVFRK